MTQFGNLGFIEAKRSRNESSLHFYSKALQRFSQVEDVPRQATTLYNIGLAHQRLGDLRTAAHFMRQCADFAEGAAPRDARKWLAAHAAAEVQRQSPSLSVPRRATLAPLGMPDEPSDERLPEEPIPRLPLASHRGGAQKGPPPPRRLPHGRMLEHGMENLPFSDVAERAEQSLARMDALAQLLEARAVAEERYAQGLQDVHEGGRTGRTGQRSEGLLASAFGGLSLLGKKEVAVESDQGTLQAAIDELRGLAARVRRDGRGGREKERDMLRLSLSLLFRVSWRRMWHGTCNWRRSCVY